MMEDEKPIELCPTRFVFGTWCHTRNKQIGEGDIARAYSGDTIALKGRIRKPVKVRGWLCACVGMWSRGEERKARLYRLVPESLFDGSSRTYAQVSREGADPTGFYHGMAVSHGGKRYVLVGPVIEAIPGAPAPKQADLFG